MGNKGSQNTDQEPHETEINSINLTLSNDGKMSCYWCCFPVRMHPVLALTSILRIDLLYNMCALVYGIMTLLIMYSNEKYKDNYTCTWYGCSYGTGIIITVCAGVMILMDTCL